MAKLKVTNDEDRIILAMITARDAVQALTRIGSDELQSVSTVAVNAIRGNEYYKKRKTDVLQSKTKTKTGKTGNKQQNDGFLSYAGQLEGWVITEETTQAEIRKQQQQQITTTNTSTGVSSTSSSSSILYSTDSEEQPMGKNASLIMLQSDIMIDVLEAAAADTTNR